jgi:hypothetical protein
MRERYLNLLAASMDGDTAARVHPAFLTVLRQLTPDEVRIISTFQHDGPYPLLTVGARYRFGERLSTELRHFSLLGTQAGCEHPETAALYIDNLCRLGLAELRPVRIADDTRIFRRWKPPRRCRPRSPHRGAHPELESARERRRRNRVVADVQRTRFT